MIHQPLGGVRKVSDVMITVEEIKKIKQNSTIISVTVALLKGMAVTRLLDDFEEARDYGMIDEVLVRKKDN